jgi:MraZ protein
VVNGGVLGDKVGILDKPYFRGQSVHRLDAKGRLRIPTKFREILQQHYTDVLIVTILGDCLVAYPPEVWEEKIESKAEKLSPIDPDERSFTRWFVSGATPCEFDNQGRVLIPPLLREMAGLGQEVVLAGLLTNFEIWDRSAWEAQVRRDRENQQEIMKRIAAAGF